MLTLTQDQRDSFPDDAAVLFSNQDKLRLFSKKRLSSLNSIYLKDFGNGDLLAIAAASGYDQKKFFSGFDCLRIGSFAQDIKDLFKDECGF